MQTEERGPCVTKEMKHVQPGRGGMCTLRKAAMCTLRLRTKSTGRGQCVNRWRRIGTPVRTNLFPWNQHLSHLSVEPLHLADYSLKIPALQSSYIRFQLSSIFGEKPFLSHSHQERWNDNCGSSIENLCPSEAKPVMWPWMHTTLGTKLHPRGDKTSIALTQSGSGG